MGQPVRVHGGGIVSTEYTVHSRKPLAAILYDIRTCRATHHGLMTASEFLFRDGGG